MPDEKRKKKKLIRRALLLLAAGILLLAAGAVAVSLLTARPAVRTLEEYRAAFPDTMISVSEDGSVELMPGEAVTAEETGIIFYVGAQITPDAYIPLLARLASQGYFCSIPKIPFHMASMKPNAAEPVMAAHPEIKSWYLAGHSMGGLTASGFAADHPEKTDGLILIAAYTARDLSPAVFPVLSVYGDTDSVLNAERYEKSLAMYPADFEEHVLRGANHAQFGDYGPQPRDSEATISADEQQAETAAILCDWLARHKSSRGS